MDDNVMHISLENIEVLDASECKRQILRLG